MLGNPAGLPGSNAPTLSLSLAQALELQRQSNRQIRAAARQAEIASAEVQRVNVRPNPSVTAQVANSEPNRYRPAGTDRLLRIDQLVERGGKRELRTRQAQALEQASKWDLADASRLQRNALLSAYYDLAAAQEQLTLAAMTVAEYERLVAASERRRAAGDLAPVDVSRLRVEAARAENDRRQQQSQLELARVGLAAVIGQEALADRLAASEGLPTETDVDDALRRAVDWPAASAEEWLARRADVLAAQSRVDAAQRAIDLARSQRDRDVSIGLQTERPAALGGHVFGVSATIPLFVNNDYSGDIARAMAELDAARDDLQRMRAQLRSDYERATSQLRSAAERLRRARANALPEALRVSEAIEYAFSRGAVPLTDLFDTRRQLLAVRTDLIAAQLDFAKARAAFEAATWLETVP